MAKTALGRRLENLMRAARTAPAGSGPAAGSAPGLAGLVRGGMAMPEPEKGPLTASPRGAEPQTLRRKRMLQVSLVLGDVLLVALAVRSVASAPGPLGFSGAVLCSAAVFVGAWLSCLAFWLD